MFLRFKCSNWVVARFKLKLSKILANFGTHYPISNHFHQTESWTVTWLSGKLPWGWKMLHKWQWELHDKWINKTEDFICAPETCFQRMEIISPSAVTVVVVLLQCSVFHTLPCLKLHRKSSSAHQNFYEASIRNFIPDFVNTDPTVKLQTYLELLYSYREVIDGKSCSLSIWDVWLAILGDACIFRFDILCSVCTWLEYFFS